MSELPLRRGGPGGRDHRGCAGDHSAERLAEAEREKLIGELQSALASIKTLRGFLPICASCKKIRDDKGYWNQLESYIHEHTDVEFSHGICPECAKTLYPEYYHPSADRSMTLRGKSGNCFSVSILSE